MTWLELMPRLPLARGVPVICIDDLLHGWGASFTRRMDDIEARAVVTYAEPGRVLAIHDCDGEEVEVGAAHDYRIDLDDPQGFGYALTLARRDGPIISRDGAMVDRHLLGQTTDEDRLTLARALAELPHKAS